MPRLFYFWWGRHWMDYKQRVADFDRVLRNDSNDSIELDELIQLCLQGIPDTLNLRPTAWRLLLGYLPPNKCDWKEVLHSKRTTYYNFVQDLLVDPFVEATKSPRSNDHDHPLSPSANSKWTTYYSDNETLEQIDKDVRRTLPDIAFFQLPVPSSDLSPLSPRLKPTQYLTEEIEGRASLDALTLDKSSSPSKHDLRDISTPTGEHVRRVSTRRTIFARIRYLNKGFGSREHQTSQRTSLDNPGSKKGRIASDDDTTDLHWEAVERILFVYAKLNPGIGYVQGMNEILAPLYYVLANDEDESYRAHAEADSFFAFTSVMAESRDLFERTHDHDAGNGIDSVLSRFMERLKMFDYELWSDFNVKEIHPTYFAFRWFTCLLAQEFSLPDVIRLFDSVLADEKGGTDNRIQSGERAYLMDFCCALLIYIREDLLGGTFSDNIKLLQQYPVADITPLLVLANTLRQRRLGLNGQPPMDAAEDQSFMSTKFARRSPSFSVHLQGSSNLPQSSATWQADRSPSYKKSSNLSPLDNIRNTFSAPRFFQGKLASISKAKSSNSVSVESDTTEYNRPGPLRLQSVGAPHFTPPSSPPGSTRPSADMPPTTHRDGFFSHAFWSDSTSLTAVDSEPEAKTTDQHTTGMLESFRKNGSLFMRKATKLVSSGQKKSTRDSDEDDEDEEIENSRLDSKAKDSLGRSRSNSTRSWRNE